jgi:hypothetical protein
VALFNWSPIIIIIVVVGIRNEVVIRERQKTLTVFKSRYIDSRVG